MKEILGVYISVMIPLFVWFIISAILEYRDNCFVFGGEYGNKKRLRPNMTIWNVLFGNRTNSSGGFNEPTLCIILVTSVYAFSWTVYFVFHFNLN